MSFGVFEGILVVDDDAAQVHIVTSVLDKAGYRVERATSGLAALELAATLGEPIYLLVTDLDMPDMNGRTLAVELRKKWPDLKILFLTAFADELFRGTGLLETHEAFLEKPVSAAGLLEAVNLLLHRPSRLPGPADPLG